MPVVVLVCLHAVSPALNPIPDRNATVVTNRLEACWDDRCGTGRTALTRENVSSLVGFVMNPSKRGPATRGYNRNAARCVTIVTRLRDDYCSLNISLMHISRTSSPLFLHAAIRSHTRRVLAAFACVLVPAISAHAQQGGGAQSTGSATPPAASANVKRVAEREDPINFLLEKKKMLVLERAVEDSLKNFRKEMQRYQDVVYKDLDKAATRKEQGQLPGPIMIATLTKESEERVKDIQSAYRDRARLLLTERQRTVVDSLEGIWKRTAPKSDSAIRRPPSRI